MRQLWTIVGFDLRQRARDKSVFIFGIVVPLALMGVLNVLFSGLDEDAELDPVTVAASVPADDPVATVITDTLARTGAVDVTLHEVAAGEVRDLVDNGDAELGVAVGDEIGRASCREGVEGPVVAGVEA